MEAVQAGRSECHDCLQLDYISCLSFSIFPFDKIESWTDFGSCLLFSAALASSDVHGVFVPAASDDVRFDFSSGNLDELGILFCFLS